MWPNLKLPPGTCYGQNKGFRLGEDIGNKPFCKNRIFLEPNLQHHSMYHSSQESSAMLNEHRRRNMACYEQKRRSELNRSRLFMQRVPDRLPRHPLTGKIRLSMDVQCSDFASLMGQRESWSVNDSISKIMQDTGCMIQFADQHVIDKSSVEINQVTITGEFPNVDEAQRRIRALSPITICISLKHIKAEFAGKDLNKYLIKWRLPADTSAAKLAAIFGENCEQIELNRGVGELADFSKIQFYVIQPSRLNNSVQDNLPILVIRGSYCDHEKMIKASNRLYSLLFEKNSKEEFASRMQIPLWRRRWVVGAPDGILMRAISKMSSCTIHFPVSSHGQNATSYFLSGNASSVIEAARMINKVGPVQMEFDVDNSALQRPIKAHQDNKRNFDRFDTENNVIVSVRKSQLEGEFRLDNEEMRHFIIMMTSEENVHGMYRVRRKLLNDRVLRCEAPLLKGYDKRPKFIEYLNLLIIEASTRVAKTKSSGSGTARVVKK